MILREVLRTQEWIRKPQSAPNQNKQPEFAKNVQNHTDIFNSALAEGSGEVLD